MALRLLAGPFAITDQFGPVVAVNSPAAWVPNFGAVVRYKNADGERTGMLSLDGRIERFCDRIDHNGNLYGWDAQNRVVLFGENYDDGAWEVVRDSRSFLSYRSEKNAAPANVSYVKLLDRRIKFPGHDVHAIVGGVDLGAENLESTGLFNPIASPGRNDHEVFLANTATSGGLLACRFYDSDTRRMSSGLLYLPTASGYACVALYAQELGVVVLINWNRSVATYSLSPLPASVGGPVVVYGSVAKGAVATFRSHVSGAQGEPCEGELVDWSIAGAGALLDAQSETDSLGNAQARVLYSVSAFGDSTVMASVRC